MLRSVIDSLLTTVFPQECHACGGPVESYVDGVACGECWMATRLFDGTEELCTKCGAYLNARSSGRPLPCGQCRDDAYDQAIAAGVYEKALAATVVQLKKRPDLPRRVRELLESLLMRVPVSENTVIIPVPLSRKRRYERGHNQAEVIGRVLADHSDLPIVVTALIRTDNSRMHRVGMDKRAREATVKSSFHVRTPRLIAGKDVLLVDDVFTSGSTASYCAKKLKENGAVSVKVITLARAVLLS